MTATRALWTLIVASTLCRLAWAASLGPGNDEAYHALFADHPDWSYFDHPPMLALVESIGPALAGGTIASSRLGFIALFAGSTWLLARLTSRFFGKRAGVLAALALNATAYYGMAVGTFVLPDGPLLFFWLLTLDRLARARETPDRIGPWVGTGLAFGGAMLSKYHAAFLPAGVGLYLIIEPSARSWWKKPGPYLALAIGLLLFSPVIWWNAKHGWASFAFQGGRAVGRLRFRPECLASAIVGQAMYLFPWVWLPLVLVMARLGRTWRTLGQPERFLLSQAVSPLAAFGAVACLRPILPHWPLIGFVSIVPILGRDWADRLETHPGRSRRRLAIVMTLPIVLGSLVVAQAGSGWLQDPKGRILGLVAATDDPTLDLHGWDQIARELRRRGLLSQPGTFLFTGNWYQSAQLAFATGGESPVVCYHAGDSRGFADWSRPEDWLGRDGILVAIDDRSTEPRCFERWFYRIEPIGRFSIVRGRVRVRSVRLFRCVRQTRAFPFARSRLPDRVE